MRSLFIASPGTVLVGHDAAALEARIMGHYTYPFDDGEFAHNLLHGDIHTANANYFGVSRNDAKTIFYAVLYGAQPGKICTILKCNKKRGQEVFDEFWLKNFALGKVREKVLRIGKQGWLPGLDGRRIWLRGSEHAWLNALFQAAGATAMNYSMVILHENCKRLGIEFTQVIYYHDEIASEIPVEHIQLASEPNDRIVSKCNKYFVGYGEQAVLSIREAGKLLKLRCDLDSEYQVGDSWAEIH